MNDLIYTVLIWFVLIVSPCAVIGSLVTGEIVDDFPLFLIVTIAEVLYLIYIYYKKFNNKLLQYFKRHKYTAFVLTGLFISICLTSIFCLVKPEPNIDELISEYVKSYDVNIDCEFPKDTLSDSDTYIYIHELCNGYIDAYEKMEYDLSEESIIEKLHIDSENKQLLYIQFYNLIYEYNKDKELRQIFKWKLGHLIDNSTTNFLYRKTKLITYFNEDVLYYLPSIEQNISNDSLYSFNTILDIDFSSNNQDNSMYFLSEMYYNLYPQMMLNACDEFIKEISKCYEWEANEKVNLVERFLKSFNLLEAYQSKISNSMNMVKNQEISSNDLPHIGMPIYKLRYTALGEPDEIELSTDYYKTTSRARHRIFIWYKNGKLCARAYIYEWDWKNKKTVPEYIFDITYFGEYDKFNNTS